MAAEWAVGIVAKAAGPIFGKLTMSAWQKVALSWLVAWGVRKLAKEQDLPVPVYWPLRKYLSSGEPLSALRSASPERVEDLARSLRTQPLGAEFALTEVQSKEFVELLLSVYTRGLTANEAIEVQSAVTRADIKKVQVLPAAAFEADLGLISPMRANQARNLVDRWPEVHRFVREFVSARDPKTALQDWTQNPPAWLSQINAEALAWMAELAADFGANKASIALIDQALDQGVTPANYWRIRRALVGDPPSVEAQRESMRQYQGHPLADSIVAAIDGSTGEALKILDGWDTPEAPERALKTAIRCQFLAANDDIDGAVRLARSALEDDKLTGPAQLAADYLLQRGSVRDSTLHFADLEASLDLALTVRDTIRGWKGPSYRAVATAIQAAQALGNSQRAWSLSQPAPAGQATDEEARSDEVRNLALVIAADTRPDEEVRILLNEVGDALTRLEAQALMAEHRQDEKEALELWLKAAQLASTPSQQFRFGFQIAMHGQMPQYLEALSADHAEVVGDLNLIAAAFSGVPGQFEILRSRARVRRPLAFALYKYFDTRSDFVQAAKTAAAAAEHWSDPELWHIASNAYIRSGDRNAAVKCARRALTVARPHWGKHDAVYANLIEILSNDGRWGEAADAAAELMSRNPDSPSAVWALVECQMRLGQLDEAWKTYSDFGGRPTPSNERQAVFRVELWRRYQHAGESLSDLLDVLDMFTDNRRVRAFVAKALMSASGDLPEKVAEQIKLRLAELLPSLEDVFVPQEIDLENPLAVMDSLVAQLPDTSDVDRQIEEGTLPFGLAASIHHKSYVELLVCRTGAVFAGEPTAVDAEVASARSARSDAVVVDVTALISLGFFDNEVGDQLLGYLGQTVAPLEQLLDTIHAVDTFSHRSTMSVGKTSAGTARINLISDEEAEARFDRATRVHRLFQTLKSQERSSETNLPDAQREDEVFVWLTALDLAMDQPRRPLWCDDANVRQLAASFGIPTFGTSALIDAMCLDGILSADLATTLQAILIHHHYVGAQFRRDWLEAAATLENWRAEGYASFIMWAPSIPYPEGQVSFALEALRRSVEDPGSIQRWVEATSRWLIRIGQKDAYSNLVLFLQRLLDQPWLTATRLPFVLAGIRAATDSTEVDDPFETALASYYQSLTERRGPEIASHFVRGLVHLTTADDRSTTSRIILTS